MFLASRCSRHWHLSRAACQLHRPTPRMPPVAWLRSRWRTRAAWRPLWLARRCSRARPQQRLATRSVYSLEASGRWVCPTALRGRSPAAHQPPARTTRSRLHRRRTFASASGAPRSAACAQPSTLGSRRRFSRDTARANASACTRTRAWQATQTCKRPLLSMRPAVRGSPRSWRTCVSQSEEARPSSTTRRSVASQSLPSAARRWFSFRHSPTARRTGACRIVVPLSALVRR
mmetsp:Transcript_5106/g.15596  ORF Transcript_5106/g.15596 Transcript_5106/m.15596 type:complete len:232 (+) Transcript_5106:382-1077(+)